MKKLLHWLQVGTLLVKHMVLATLTLLALNLKVQAFKIWDLAGSINLNRGKALTQLPAVLKALGHQTLLNGIWVILMSCLDMTGNLLKAQLAQIFGMPLIWQSQITHPKLMVQARRFQ